MAFVLFSNSTLKTLLHFPLWRLAESHNEIWYTILEIILSLKKMRPNHSCSQSLQWVKQPINIILKRYLNNFNKIECLLNTNMLNKSWQLMRHCQNLILTKRLSDSTPYINVPVNMCISQCLRDLIIWKYVKWIMKFLKRNQLFCHSSQQTPTFGTKKCCFGLYFFFSIFVYKK